MPRRLAHPIPKEAVTQLRRHLTLIQRQRGFNNNIDATNTTLIPESVDKSNLSGDKKVAINVEWGVDSFIGFEANNQMIWLSQGTLFCYLLEGKEKDPQGQIADLFQDIVRYFYDDTGDERWTLFTENKIDCGVVRQLIFKSVNRDFDFDKSPIIKADIAFDVRWACLKNDLHQPI